MDFGILGVNDHDLPRVFFHGIFEYLKARAGAATAAQFEVDDERETNTGGCHPLRDNSDRDLLFPQCGQVLRPERSLSLQSHQHLRNQRPAKSQQRVRALF